ncbi:T9SS type A sorting domain-containing protein [Chitinophaga oryzae]|uniref:T9SS type A sorting domain-containing protein n=1 Tax=Chitinophaga oryzae TaxID=2725414 RepID=A0ABX6LA77_9BACT|nr:T9SS type A sorting domain-containing protein [Chitinophaga oryzae]QJB36978.1 T9SS type A sorting domain-containing protein [Chitinophaga oryzae]
MNSGKHALDYITHFQRLEPHGVFLHAAETVNPLLNITGFPPGYFTSTDVEPIPAPSSAGSPVAGQPTASFNSLPAAERVMTGYNANITSVVYASEGSLTASQSETVVNITFIALKETVVLAWGGHIASVIDWGKDPVTGETNSASAINGSPYHMRLKNWIIDGNVVSIGNQDRSLKTNAVFIPPQCTVSGPTTGCVETTSLSYTSTVDDASGLTYLWSITGSNTANAKIVNNTVANIQVVPVGAAFTAGTFTLRLIVTRNGLSDTCYLNSHVSPGDIVTISKVMVNAGTDQTITNLDTAFLSASASGGTTPYAFSWSPVTGLSDPNIFNPEFVPPSTGTFQFVVTATDKNGCSGKDTVVITVVQHPEAPCLIDGPDPVCPGSVNVYQGPLSGVGSYKWSITGNGSITGATTKDTVTVMAGNTCGAYTLQLMTTSPDGKVTKTCEHTFYVKDTIAPVLSGTAADVNISCSKDLPAAPVITASDNCLANVQVQMSQHTIDSTCVNKYTLVRKWWAVDACGNTSDTLKQTITVNDNVKPVITADFDKEVSVQCLGDIPALPAPTATDNCDATVTPVYSETGSGSACDSTIVRTWVFTDVCGNSDSVKQTIHIKDNTAPVLSGEVTDLQLSCAKDIPGPQTITAKDNCGNATVYYSAETTDSTCVNKFTLVRKWWAVDACGNTSDTLKQTITVNDNVKPVITADFDKEVSVQCLGDIPALPAPTATDNCDATLTPVYSEIGSGSACDSTIVRTWIFTDVCGNSDSVKQTVHIKDNTAPVLSGEVTDLQLSCAKDIPGPQTITAKDNCGNATVYYSAETTDSTCVNKFTLSRKWWAVDACGNKSDTLRQTIVVNDNTAPVVVTKGDDKLINCGAAVIFDTPTFSDNCGGQVYVTTNDRKEGSNCPFTYIRRWTATDECGNATYVEQAITVSCCASYCTYTQGFYGNKNGLGCTPGGGSFTAKQMMTQVLDAQAGDSVFFGLKTTGKFFTLFLSDITSDNIFYMLPGGSTPLALKGYATYSKPSTWSNVPISTAKSTFGKINNALLAQTMALFFNMGVTPTLSGLTIQGDTLFTAKLTACGSTTPVSKIDTFRLPKNVVNYLGSIGQSTVQGLYVLANQYLGGQTVTGISVSDVNAAVDAINNGFDKCAVLVGWGKSVTTLNNAAVVMAVNQEQAIINEKPAVSKLTVSVFPNPYSDVITFRYVAPEAGKVQLELYDLQGRLLAVAFRGEVSKGGMQQIEYRVPDNNRVVLIYKLTVGQSTTTGKIVPFK